MATASTRQQKCRRERCTRARSPRWVVTSQSVRGQGTDAGLQVEDFVEFRERLLSSLSKRLNCIEGLRLEVLNTVPSAFDFDEADVLMSGASLTGTWWLALAQCIC